MLIEICFIELEYICQLTDNSSQNYTNKFIYTDNIMCFCSTLVRLESGWAVLHLLWPGCRENDSAWAQLVKNTHFTWHFQSENSIKEWDNLHDINPKFIVCLSEATIQRMQNAIFLHMLYTQKSSETQLHSRCIAAWFQESDLIVAEELGMICCTQARQETGRSLVHDWSHKISLHRGVVLHFADRLNKRSIWDYLSSEVKSPGSRYGWGAIILTRFVCMYKYCLPIYFTQVYEHNTSSTV